MCEPELRSVNQNCAAMHLAEEVDVVLDLLEERLRLLAADAELPSALLEVQVLADGVDALAQQLVGRAAVRRALEVVALVDRAVRREDVGRHDEVHLADAGEDEAVGAHEARQQRVREALDVADVARQDARETSLLAVRDRLDQVEPVAGGEAGGGECRER